MKKENCRRRRKTPKDTSREDKEKKLLVKLSWWILEQKLKYYHPEYGKAVSDTEYDKNELIYKKLCKKHGVKPTASESVGFPWDRPCAKLVVDKFKRKNR